jgi:hypothetical protein
MFEAVKVSQYVKKHNKEIDVWIRSFFDHWNKIGQLNRDVNVSNKMQQIYLVSIVRILFEKSGMPKADQKKVLQGLLDSLGE